MAEDYGEDTYLVPAGYEVVVKKGQTVPARGVMAKSTMDKSVLRAAIEGDVQAVKDGKIVVKHTDIQDRSYEFGPRESLLVKSNQIIEKGQPLNVGHFNLQDLLEKKGPYSVQNYIMHEVQHIYASQGQTINDKHLEIIVRKMFSKVRIIDAGDTTFLPGETVDLGDVIHQNEKLQEEKKKDARIATYEQLLLGITRAALATDSWLAGASFQETIRVLVEAATTRKVDSLQDLKANVIIGRLIPTGEVYRKRYLAEQGIKEDEE